VAGALLLVVAVVALLVTVLAQLNPWRLVGLSQDFGDPFVDAFAAMACLLVGFWLAAPVRNSATQRVRARMRALLLVLTGLSGLLVPLSLQQAWFRYEPQVVARDPHSDRVLAQIGVHQGIELHIFAGTGFLARDLGNFGSPCGLSVVASFGDPGRIVIATVYGDYTLAYDQASGEPIDHVPASCTVSAPARSR